MLFSRGVFSKPQREKKNKEDRGRDSWKKKSLGKIVAAQKKGLELSPLRKLKLGGGRKKKRGQETQSGAGE